MSTTEAATRRKAAKRVTAEKAVANKRLTIGEILYRCEGRVDFCEGLPLLSENRTAKAMAMMARCKAGQLGAKEVHCDHCNADWMLMLRCGDRHCAMCSSYGRHVWHERILSWNLPCQYLHNVTTLPHDLNDLVAANPGVLLRVLLSAARLANLRFAREHHDCYLPGLVLVLHTWGQRLNRHYHVHVIMTAGGLNPDGTHWTTIDVAKATQQKAILAKLFKAEFLKGLRTAIKKDQLRLPKSLADVEALDRLVSKVCGIKWIANIQGPREEHHDGAALIGYLSGYVNGSAIGNSRLVSDVDGQVTFRIKDYRQGSKGTETLSETEFVRRIGYHVLPSRMTRVRYAGLFGGRDRQKRIEISRRLLAKQQSQSADEADGDEQQRPQELFVPERQMAPCPKCDRPRETIRMIDSAVTMMVLAVTGMMIDAYRRSADTDWLTILRRVVIEQRRAKTRNNIIRSLASGVMKLDDPVMQLVRIHYAERVEAEQESSQSRGPPKYKRAAG